MHKLIKAAEIQIEDGFGRCDFMSAELGNETFYSIVFESRHAPELINKIRSSTDKEQLLGNMTINIMKRFGVDEGVQPLETNAMFMFDEIVVINTIMKIHDVDGWFNEIIQSAKIDRS